MKTSALTMAELTVALVVLIILTFVSLSTMKKVELNEKELYLYTIIDGLEKINGGIAEKYGSFYPDVAKEFDLNNSNDWYCLQVADMFSTKGNINCARTSNPFQKNIELANGASIMGLSSEWVYSDTSQTSWYKTILIDVDSTRGKNQIGIDRFPYRIHRDINAFGTYLAGVVFPACTIDVQYNKKGEKSNYFSSFCEDNFKYFQRQNPDIKYDIYRANLDMTASPVAYNIPAEIADCMAYGGSGALDPVACSVTADLSENCANTTTCEICSGTFLSGATYNVCPNKKSTQDCIANMSNKEDTSCFLRIHRPSATFGPFASSILNGLR